jgi:transcriptional regulator with XRE-family HTH domain
MSSFGDLVKKLRKDRGMTLEQVARKIGSHKGYVSGIENGKVNPPSVKFIRKFAKVFQYDEKDMVRMATVDKAPIMVRDEFRSALAGGAPDGGIPLLNTVESGYATDIGADGKPKALVPLTLRLPRFKVEVQLAVTVVDGSMEGSDGISFAKGDVVLLAPARKLASGGIFYVMYRQKGARRAAVRNVQIEQADRVVLQPLNRDVQPESLSHDDIDAFFRVVGRIAVFEGAPVGSAV